MKRKSAPKSRIPPTALIPGAGAPHAGLPLPPGPLPTGSSGRELGFLLKQTHHMVNTAIESEMRAHGLGLTFPRAVAMVSLVEDEGLSNAELARQAMVSPQTMHQILLRLEQDGLVVRSAHPEHGRVRRTALTDAGRALLIRGVAVSEPVFARMLHGLSAHECAELARLLGHCIGNLARDPEAAETNAPSADDP